MDESIFAKEMATCGGDKSIPVPKMYHNKLTPTGVRCHEEVSAECGASKPHLLTSTRLRKHVATTTQVLGLKEHEMDMLANFLGHDIIIHTKFYRMPLDVLQIARVSKVFLAAERGHSSRCAERD